MRKRVLIISLFVLFTAELTVLLFFAWQPVSTVQDTVLVNEVLHSIQEDWGRIEQHQNTTGLDYTVLAQDGSVCFQTRTGLSETLQQAIRRRDTILDIKEPCGMDSGENGAVVGKVLIANDSIQMLQSQKRVLIAVLALLLAGQTVVCAVWLCYLTRIIIRPFEQLKSFAERVAGGNLDIPLTMNRHNLFGAFTESFDIMRAELKRARQAEVEANRSKKELVAKLSHDIKTPVASIKAVSEVGVALIDRERSTEGEEPGDNKPLPDSLRLRENYIQIIQKADQINSLITNLFTATLEELLQLSVTPEDVPSKELRSLLQYADYLHRASFSEIPECMLSVDKLRLQQVFDNLFANSYKYANTDIQTRVYRKEKYLAVEIEDFGDGVEEEELPLLKQKFKRGKNAKGVEGAGLGLYISDYFIKEMKGQLLLENQKKEPAFSSRAGLKVTILLPLSGLSDVI